mmetsp:Transcript_12028/g.19570  ORF Transcript_12028/g.19570 Transcript_12028/m.19570 type:complete len:81 (+) Transcript_12028:59-301(+)
MRFASLVVLLFLFTLALAEKRPTTTKGSAMIQLTSEVVPGSEVATRRKLDKTLAELDKLECQEDDAEAGRCDRGDDTSVR